MSTTISKAKAYRDLERIDSDLDAELTRLQREKEVEEQEISEATVEIDKREATLREQMSTIRDRIEALASELIADTEEVAAGVPNYRSPNDGELSELRAPLQADVEVAEQALEEIEQQRAAWRSKLDNFFGDAPDRKSASAEQLTRLRELLIADDWQEYAVLKQAEANAVMQEELDQLLQKLDGEQGELSVCTIGEYKQFAGTVHSRCERVRRIAKAEEAPLEARIAFLKAEFSRWDSWASTGDYVQFSEAQNPIADIS